MSSATILNQQPSGGNNQRRSSRRRVETLAYVDLGPGNGGFPINVSEGGMTFQGIQPLQKNQVIRVRFKLPGIGSSMEATGEVAWLNGLGKGGGMQFIDLPEETRRLINEWLLLHTPSGAVKSAATFSKAAKTTPGPAAPAIPVVAEQKDSSPVIDSKAFESHRNATPSAAPAAAVLTTSILMAPSQVSRNSSPLWIKQLSLGLLATLAIVALPGLSSYHFRPDLHLPDVGAFFAHAFTASHVSTLPESPSEPEIVTPPPSVPAASEPAEPVTAASSTPAEVSSNQAAAPTLTMPAPRPVVKATVREIHPNRTTFARAGMAMKPMRRNPAVTSPAADLAPPTLVAPAIPQLALQFAALPPAAPASQVAQSNGKFVAAQLLARRNPVYPAAARTSGIAGAVELHYVIGAAGEVRDVTVVKGNPVLARAAMDALQMWRYEPARRDGVPVDMESRIVFDFKRTLTGADQEFLFVTSDDLSPAR